MSRIGFTDRQWAFIRDLLPLPAHTGRPRADDRRTIEGILYVLVTGCRWQDLPREYGAPTTVWRRLKRWGEEGVWERIWRAALAALDQQGQLDWTMAFLNGSFVPARKGGDQVRLTKKGKGTKWMLVVVGHGLPLGFHLDSADCAEVRLAERTLDTTQVTRPRGRPRRRPEKLVADRGYDSSAFRRTLRRRGIGMCIPAKRRPKRWRPKRGRPVLARREEYRERYKVERSFAWLGNFRRLLIRWEHRGSIYRGFFTVAVLLTCLRRVCLLARRWTLSRQGPRWHGIRETQQEEGAMAAAKTPYLERYVAGEHEPVWAELQALGAAVRAEPLYNDAQAVARETMRRVRHNIETLIPRLKALGYEFGYRWAHGRNFPSGPPDPVFAPPQPDVAQTIAELEDRAGALPLSLRAFYEVVGSVNFVGQPPEAWTDWRAVPDDDDALYIYSAEIALEDTEAWQERYDYLREDEGAHPVRTTRTYAIPAPTTRCRTIVGSCPSPPMSGTSTTSAAVGRTRSRSPTSLPTRLLTERHRTTFVNYLRICCRWAGFPKLEQVSGAPVAVSALSALTRDLLPL